MHKSRFLVTCQYEENYGFHSGGVHWKPKGSVNIEVYMDLDMWMYAEEATRSLISKKVKSLSNDAVRYTMVSIDMESAPMESWTIESEEIGKELDLMTAETESAKEAELIQEEMDKRWK